MVWYKMHRERCGVLVMCAQVRVCCVVCNKWRCAGVYLRFSVSFQVGSDVLSAQQLVFGGL